MDNITQNNNIQDSEKDFEFLGAPLKDSAPKNKKPIGKKLRPVIILCAVALVLFASVFVLKEVVPSGDSGITEIKKDEDEIVLVDITGTTAKTLTVKTPNDEYTFVRRLEKTYYIDGKRDLPLNMSKVLSALTYAGSISAETEVAKKVTDWQEYGLKTPAATVTWTKDDATHYFELGDIAPSGNYYMRFNGGDTVYTYDATAAEIFTSSHIEFYDTTLFSYNSQTDAPYITEFSIYQKDGEEIIAQLVDLSNEEDINDTAYVLKSPIQHNFSVEKFNLVNELMENLTTLTVFSDDISRENLEKYGLNDPQYTFTFTNVAVKNVIHFGNTSDKGYVYAYAEGKDFIYIIDKNYINALTFDIAAYCDSMSYTRSYDTIDTITITGGGKTYNIDITGTSDDGDLKAYINNKYVEYENFASLYAHIIGIDITDVAAKPEGASPFVTITVDCLDGTTDILKYYKISDLKSFYELNGSGRLVVSTSNVEKILEFAQMLYDGKEIIFN